MYTASAALDDESAVAARMDNQLVPLSQTIVGSTVQLEAVYMNSTDGIRVLVETLKFLLKIAKHRCEPDLAIVIGRPIGSSYFCTLSDSKTGEQHVPTAEELEKLQR